MSKRVPLDTSQFHVDLPPERRDPLDTLIPQLPPEGNAFAKRKSGLVDSPFFRQSIPRPQDLSRMISQNAINPSAAKYIVVEPKNDGGVEVSNDGKVEKTKREITRRAFDVYSDQVISLQRIQLIAVTSGKKKPKIGSMVRSALDKLIASELRKHEGH